MAQLTAIKDRIRLIRNIGKVTKAMELVTLTKINKVRANHIHSKSYYKQVSELFTYLKSLYKPETEEPVKLLPYKVVFAIVSQKGFCGGFNDKILHYLAESLSQQNVQKLIMIGKKNSKWHLLPKSIEFTHLACRETNYQNEISPEISDIARRILNQQPVEFHIIYNQYKSILEQNPGTLKLYPVVADPDIKKQDFIFEPNLKILFEHLLKSYLTASFEKAYWESITGEYCSRLLSMRNANDNSGIILDDLKIQYNKTRQLRINQELSEIVSAFDVLKIIQDKKTEQEEVYS